MLLVVPVKPLPVLLEVQVVPVFVSLLSKLPTKSSGNTSLCKTDKNKLAKRIVNKFTVILCLRQTYQGFVGFGVFIAAICCDLGVSVENTVFILVIK